jgi:hypothetical protein
VLDLGDAGDAVVVVDFEAGAGLVVWVDGKKKEWRRLVK